MIKKQRFVLEHPWTASENMREQQVRGVVGSRRSCSSASNNSFLEERP